jgi:hypothetical protein
MDLLSIYCPMVDREVFFGRPRGARPAGEG